MWSAVSLTVPQKCLTLSLKAVKNKQKAGNKLTSRRVSVLKQLPHACKPVFKLVVTDNSGNKLTSRRVSVLKQLPHACKPVFKLVVTDNSGNSNRAFRSLTVKL